jgi:hypothetical protein
MKIQFTLTDDAGDTYQGAVELKPAPIHSDFENSRASVRADREAKGLPGHILGLREEGFFREPRTPSEVHAKLLESYHCLLNRVQMGLLRLLRRRELRKTTKRLDDQDQLAYVW